MPVRATLTALTLALVVVPIGPAGATPVVESLTAAATPSGVVVTGRASFAPQATTVAEDPPGDAAVGDIGADLVRATIDPRSDEVRFRLDVADAMPDLEAPPETLHYNWPILVRDSEGERGYRLQAIRTSTVQDLRDTRVPAGEPVFRVLACTRNATGGNSCSQTTRVPGTFGGGVVELRVPRPAIGAGVGAVIEPGAYPPNASAGASGLGWFEDGTGGDAMAATPLAFSLGTVSLTLARAASPPGATGEPVAAKVEADGSFRGELPLPSTTGTYRITARACQSTVSCAVATTTVEVATVPPPDQPYDPVLVTQQVYFHCPPDTRVGNVAAAQGIAAPWDSTPPTGSLAAGDGCVAADPPARNTTTQVHPADAVWEGTVHGNVDSMTIRAYVRQVDGRGDQETFTVLPRVSIDGEVRLGPVSGSIVVTRPAAGTVQGTSVIELTVTNLGFTRKADDNRSHDVIFSLDSYYIEQSSVWLWDAADISSGITFNPPQPTDAVVRAPDRDPA
ncbi:MAG: hypothetical protein M3245_02510 [Actinomycetota bacterium]|nr:hypothetical protein [Actinomycetota bacterium]